MINTRKLIKLAKKWQKMAALKRKRISLPEIKNYQDASSEASCRTASKGHFVAYSIDQKRFVFPIAYLNMYIFRELLRMSEEEFGLPSDGPITLPCDAVAVEYIASMIQRHIDGDMEKALFMSMAASRCFVASSLYQGQNNQQLLICSF